MNVILKRKTSDDLDFQNLVVLLDQDLKIRDGKDHSFYAQFNTIDKIRNVVIYYLENNPVGCGAFKEFDENTVEIKRMFVLPDFRGQGIAFAILKELEYWAAEIKYSISVLETGKKQPEAIGLYQRAGYVKIPNYGQYENIESSVCMKKRI